ncbi:MAG: hypothetical protein KDB40_21725 [Acidimicrobiales bacterium]|nr:hypothetical protein [Acidimicrobiales bacterium]
MIAAGSVVTGVSATGVIAPASDAARTGAVEKEHVETAAFDRAVDLQLATFNGVACGDFTDDLDGPLTRWTIDERDTPSFSMQTGDVCLRNAGSEPTRIRIRTVDIVGTDLTCEPDEAPACGGNGELALRIQVPVRVSGDPAVCPEGFDNWVNVSGVMAPSDIGRWVLSANSEPVAWESTTTLGAGATCVYSLRFLTLYDPDPIPFEAQTDRLEWRYRFSTI